MFADYMTKWVDRYLCATPYAEPAWIDVIRREYIGLRRTQ